LICRWRPAKIPEKREKIRIANKETERNRRYSSRRENANTTGTQIFINYRFPFVKGRA
jgi:hypothetical protein